MIKGHGEVAGCVFGITGYCMEETLNDVITRYREACVITSTELLFRNIAFCQEKYTFLYATFLTARNVARAVLRIAQLLLFSTF